MPTLIQRLEARLSVSPMSDFDRETISQALELARAEQYRVDHEAEKAKNLEGAREQAIAQMSSVSEMVAALECDYDRLDELRDEKNSLNYDVAISNQDSAKRELAKSDLRKWEKENSEELVDLETAAGNCKSEDEARERIQEDALSVEVRSSWQSAGETLEPSEFTILLCTGGPACRIVGELDQYEQPCRAWLEYQDWFTPWTELVDGVSHSDLLTYSQQFYFGE